MSSITIRSIDDSLKARLRKRAAHHGRSMEDEARDILHTALSNQSSQSMNLADSIRQRFIGLPGVELDLPKREPIREPPRFKE